MEEHTGIQGKVDIQKQTLACMCHDQETADKNIEKISPLLKKHGYTISHKKIKEQHNENI